MRAWPTNHWKPNRTVCLLFMGLSYHHMILYRFHVILCCFRLIEYGFHAIVYGFHMILYGFQHDFIWLLYDSNYNYYYYYYNYCYDYYHYYQYYHYFGGVAEFVKSLSLFLNITVWPDYQCLAGNSDYHRFFQMSRLF